ncbi:MAG: hypothetical protein A2X82_10705 [Geobacteraceae bacterium GWC2_55_20]|nr:MAG: hypothetical protein A2X82_10705 [Geobacteraceae bacterium GWC2_55_20]HBA73692.1 hypothetical protein [Geobacter sp.]HCE67216.1 hypothetical protein [Geobacter sp.]
MKIAVLFTLMSVLLISGCKSGEKNAAELLETARFEEKQNNREHATKLYDEIIRKYPSSQASRDAAARLEEIKRPKP